MYTAPPTYSPEHGPHDSGAVHGGRPDKKFRYDYHRLVHGHHGHRVWDYAAHTKHFTRFHTNHYQQTWEVPPPQYTVTAMGPGYGPSGHSYPHPYVPEGAHAPHPHSPYKPAAPKYEPEPEPYHEPEPPHYNAPGELIHMTWRQDDAVLALQHHTWETIANAAHRRLRSRNSKLHRASLLSISRCLPIVASSLFNTYL